MHRIRPSRSGLEWQENKWNRLNREKQMTGDAIALVRPGTVARRSAVQTATGQYCQIDREEYDAVLKMHRIPSNSGRLQAGTSLERPEPCEGKLSRTVLSRIHAVGQASRLSLTFQLRIEAFGFPPVTGSLIHEGSFLIMETGATPVLRVAARRSKCRRAFNCIVPA